MDFQDEELPRRALRAGRRSNLKSSLCIPRLGGKNTSNTNTNSNGANNSSNNNWLSPMSLLERFREAVFRLIMLSAFSKVTHHDDQSFTGSSTHLHHQQQQRPNNYYYKYPPDQHHSQDVADCIEFIKKKSASSNNNNDDETSNSRDSNSSTSTDLHEDQHVHSIEEAVSAWPPAISARRRTLQEGGDVGEGTTVSPLPSSLDGGGRRQSCRSYCPVVGSPLGGPPPPSKVLAKEKATTLASTEAGQRLRPSSKSPEGGGGRGRGGERELPPTRLTGQGLVDPEPVNQGLALHIDLRS
ncbi:hypothetical protein Sjap_006691 [Stephania japonica]|uniref:Uncharacterized protein n=1 Tax=Stephania japonica TaxID=461633 RepID=A0AAP0K6A5_9MAGN